MYKYAKNWEKQEMVLITLDYNPIYNYDIYVFLLKNKSL